MCQRLGMLRAKRAGKFENEFKMVKAFVKNYASNNQIKIVKVLVGRKPNPDPMAVRYSESVRDDNIVGFINKVEPKQARALATRPLAKGTIQQN